MKFIKYFGALIVVAIFLSVIVTNFSSVESRFQCSGETSTKEGPHPTTIYMKLIKYRWWVGLWSKSDGALWLEIPNKAVEYYGNIVEVGDQLQIYDSQNNIKGNFSTLSKAIFIGDFEGICKKQAYDE
jgi:hypothetical protein